MKNQLTLDVATTLHAVFCPLNHEDDILAVVNESRGLCKWYVESQCELPWEEPDHKWWAIKAAILIKTLGPDADVITDFVTSTLKICRLLIEMRTINKDAEAQLMTLLTEYHGGVI